MKKLFILFVTSSIAFYACQSEAPKEEAAESATEEVAEERKSGLFGAEFDASNPITVADLSKEIAESDSINNVTVKGELSEVCQKMGCWVKLKNDGGEDIFVKFEGHDFFAPKDAAGRQATVYGKATKEITPVADLQHYAADAGATAEEIAKITEPKEELQILATGVIIE